jgi:alanine dehydrogenase
MLRRMDQFLGARVITVYSNQDNIEQHVLDADVVIGGVLVPGAAAPKLVTRKMVEAMRPGSAIVDVAIDQGGCCETACATTHAEPTYKVDEIVHYCVANMPGGVPRTSTYALNNATLPFVLQFADKGWRKALTDDQTTPEIWLSRVACTPGVTPSQLVQSSSENDTCHSGPT